MKTRRAWIASALALGVGGCEPPDVPGPPPPQASLRHINVYDARIPAPPADVAGLYLRAVDTGGYGDRLTGVSSPAAGHAMLHETVHEGDRMRMLPVSGGLDVPPGGALELRPGAAHAMLMRLREPLSEGDRVPVELVFERAGTIGLDVPVVARAGRQGGSRDDR